MRQRLAPTITDRQLLRSYLRTALLNVDLAVDWWNQDRHETMAGNNDPTASSGVDNNVSDDVEEEEQNSNDAEDDCSSSSDGSTPGKTRSRVSARTHRRKRMLTWPRY
jgi:cobalamin biosynthesis protein CobT